MKPGDWVVPVINYIVLMKQSPDVYFSNFAPNPDTICTVVGISDLTNGWARIDVLDVEETQIRTTIPGKRIGFDPSYWRVIEQPKVNIEQLLEETESVLI